MNQKVLNKTKKIAYISFDLIFDYHSYIFCVARSYLCQHNIAIENNYRLKIETYNLKDAFNTINEEFLQKKGEYSEILKFYEKYLPTIKPQVGALDLVKILNQKQIAIKCGIEDNQELQPHISSIQEYHSQWMENMEIIDDDIQNQENVNYDIYISGDMDLLLKKKEQQKNQGHYLYIKNSDFHHDSFQENNVNNCDLIENINFKKHLGFETDYKFSEKEYYLHLNQEPKDISFKGFNKHVQLDKEYEIQGAIIKGEGKAGKDLGIHTANIDVNKQDIQKQIQHLPTGVYFGKASFQKDGFETEYPCLSFLGSSQYFQSPLKKLEGYIFHEFKEKFYDQELKITLQYFLRCEADFKAFDHLIKYIHNDVAQGKQIYQQIQQQQRQQTQDKKYYKQSTESESQDNINLENVQ